MADTMDSDAPTATPSPNTVVAGGHIVDISSSNELSSSTTKRRKVRKGTRSCWECKRRKIRCIFASPSEDDATCIGCQRRRAPCVTQELPEALAPAPVQKGNRHLSDRIARVEDFMKEYLAGTGRDDGSVGGAGRAEELAAARSSYLTPSSTRTAFEREGASSSSVVTPDVGGESSPGRLGHQPDDDDDPIETARRHLWIAFPPEEDTRILLAESATPSFYTELVNTQPHSKLIYQSTSAALPPAELPDRKAHPVTVARLMLILAITLQSPTGKKVEGLSQPKTRIERRLVAAATRWVTTDKEIGHGSVDGLVCIMLEGVFEVNSGNLRGAWAVYRRAMMVAQLMGLHRSPVARLTRIDPNLRADAEFMWFRIVYMDRYLSLLLGLPRGTSDTSMGAPTALQHEPPLGIFERQLTVIASRILERNERPFGAGSEMMTMTTTRSIDSELLTLSKSMPSSFWRPANFHNLTPGSPEIVLETIGLSAQVYYYGLLIQLHLPYMMMNTGGGGSAAQAHEYSRLTCVNAGREIVTRFVAHRTFNPVSSCSRPVDFFALLAGMTLLLAHLDAHHYPEGVATSFLAHQRFGDRAVLEQALERMDVIVSVNKGDPMMKKSAALIRHLLEIEADAAGGSGYTTTARSVKQGGVGVGVDMDEEDNKEGLHPPPDRGDLRLRIPFLGVVRISRQDPISREPPPQRELPPHADDHAHGGGSAFPTRDSSGTDEHALSSSRGTAVSEQPSDYFQASAEYDHQYTLQFPSGEDHQFAMQAQEEEGLLPPVMAGGDVDDWTFQGVDMAFFDSLMRGTPGADAVAALENQQWMDDAPSM